MTIIVHRFFGRNEIYPCYWVLFVLTDVAFVLQNNQSIKHLYSLHFE